MNGKTIIVLSLLLVLVIALTPIMQTTKATGEFSGNYTGDTTFPKSWELSARFSFSVFNGSFLNSVYNESVVRTQNFSLRFQTSIGEIPFDISLLKVTYKASWEKEHVTIFCNDIDKTHITNHTFGPNIFWSLLNFSNVPKGPNNIEFEVKTGGILVDRESTPPTYKFANLTDTENLAFTIDNGVAPTPSNTSPENTQTIDKQNLILPITTAALLIVAILSLALLNKRKKTKFDKR